MPVATVSSSSAPTITTPATAARARNQPRTRITNPTATRTPHTTDGAHRNDSTVKALMPISEPTRSQRYAVSGGSTAEAAADRLGRPGQDRRAHQEDDRQHQPCGRPGGVEGGEEDDVAPGPVDRHRVEAHPDDEDRQQRRRPRQDRPALAGDQEADADAEERPEQHEVREVGQVHDVGAEPPDQCQLEEEHQARCRAAAAAPSGARCCWSGARRPLPAAVPRPWSHAPPGRRRHPRAGCPVATMPQNLSAAGGPIRCGDRARVCSTLPCTAVVSGRFQQGDRAVAQLGSAPRSGRGGRRFKSCQPDQCDVSGHRRQPDLRK